MASSSFFQKMSANKSLRWATYIHLILHILVGENLCPQVQQHCMLPLAKICPAVFILVSQLILRPVCYDFNLLIILVLKIKLIMLYQRNLLSIVLFCIFVSVVHTPVVWHELVVIDDAQHWYILNLLQHNNIQCYCLLYHCIIFMLTQKNISAMLQCCYLDCKVNVSITHVVQVVKSMVSR